MAEEDIPTSGKAQFDAFVSYSHQYDARTAPILQKAIESALDRFFGSRSLRVFRDEANLPMSEDLWGSIVSSLDRSSFFLLIASPGSRASSWVEREIEYFLRQEGKRDRIGVVLTAGKTPWTDPDYVADADDSALGSGVTDLLTQDGREPRVVDLRPFRKANGTLKRSREFRERVAEIVARIKGVDKDVVLRAHLRERRRRVTIFLLVLVVALMMAVIAYREYRSRQDQEALRLLAEAYETLYRKPLAAVDLAFRASRIQATEQTDTALRDAQRVALKQMHTTSAENVLLSGKAGFGWERRRVTTFVSRSSPDGQHELRALATPGKNTNVQDVYLVDNESGYMRPLISSDKTSDKESISAFGFFSARDELFVLKGYHLLTFDLNGKPLTRVDYANLLSDKDPVHYLADLSNGELLLAATTSGAVWLIDPENKERRNVEPRDSRRGPMIRMVADRSGKCAMLVFEDESATVLQVSGLGRFSKSDLDIDEVITGAFTDDEDGCHLLLAGRHGLTREIKLSTKGVSELHRYAHGEEDVREIGVSSDGERVVTLTNDGAARIWQRGADRPSAVIDDQSGIDWRAWSNQSLEGETLQSIGTTQNEHVSVLFEDKVGADKVLELGGRQILLRDLFSDWTVHEIKNGKVRPLMKANPGVHQILEFNGDLWLAAHHSIYRIRGNQVFRLARKEWGTTPGMTTKVGLFPAQGKLWLGTSAGAYRIEGDRAIRMTDKSMIIANIEAVDGAVWIVAHVKLPPHGPYDTVLLQMRGDRVRKIHRISTKGTDLVQHGDNNFLAAWSRVYRFNRDSIDVVPGSRGARELFVFGGNLWFLGGDLRSSERYAYHIGPEGAQKVLAPERKANRLLWAQRKVWLTTPKGPAYVGQADGTDFNPFPDAATRVSDLLPVAEAMWIATDHGAYRFEDGEMQRIPDMDLDVVDLVEIDGAVWVVAAENAFRVLDGEVHEFRPESLEYPLKSVFSVDGRIGGLTNKVPGGGVFMVAGPIVEMHSQDGVRN